MGPPNWKFNARSVVNTTGVGTPVQATITFLEPGCTKNDTCVGFRITQEFNASLANTIKFNNTRIKRVCGWERKRFGDSLTLGSP